jgi:hypothetical protein
MYSDILKNSLQRQLSIHKFFFFIVDYVFVGFQIHGNLQICIQVICNKFYMLVV